MYTFRVQGKKVTIERGGEVVTVVGPTKEWPGFATPAAARGYAKQQAEQYRKHGHPAKVAG